MLAGGPLHCRERARVVGAVAHRYGAHEVVRSERLLIHRHGLVYESLVRSIGGEICRHVCLRDGIVFRIAGGGDIEFCVGGCRCDEVLAVDDRSIDGVALVIVIGIDGHEFRVGIISHGDDVCIGADGGDFFLLTGAVDDGEGIEGDGIETRKRADGGVGLVGDLENIGVGIARFPFQVGCRHLCRGVLHRNGFARLGGEREVNLQFEVVDVVLHGVDGGVTLVTLVVDRTRRIRTQLGICLEVVAEGEDIVLIGIEDYHRFVGTGIGSLMVDDADISCRSLMGVLQVGGKVRRFLCRHLCEGGGSFACHTEGIDGEGVAGDGFIHAHAHLRHGIVEGEGDVFAIVSTGDVLAVGYIELGGVGIGGDGEVITVAVRLVCLVVYLLHLYIAVLKVVVGDGEGIEGVVCGLGVPVFDELGIGADVVGEV